MGREMSNGNPWREHDREEALPVHSLREELLEAMQDGLNLVIRAPTGSGKSTEIPRILHHAGWTRHGTITILQPRRLAARLLARRVAQLEGCPLGAEVGYQVRFDSRAGPDTRIRYVTEGLLLRQLMVDPALRGTSVLILDEFHERHLETDVVLALARRAQSLFRPDLRILVMSATLEAEKVVEYLNPCREITSDGRQFPVEIRYWEKPEDPRIPPWEMATQGVRFLLRSHLEGDILVFQPGWQEIRRTISSLSETPECRGCHIWPLHGQCTPEEQDRVVSVSDRRRIIVATNVAETSLTLPGIRMVVDTGLARKARFDPKRGFQTLLVEKIAQSSATQRAGRAGRLGPGVCLRMWRETSHVQRAVMEDPEIRRVDLAPTALQLAAIGEVLRNPSVEWLEPPPAPAWERACILLHDLGAIDAKGTILPTGKSMAAFPVHPRISRLFLAASESGCLTEACQLAACLEDRPILKARVTPEVEKEREAAWGGEERSDLSVILQAWQTAFASGSFSETCRRLGLNEGSLRQADMAARRFLQIARECGLNPSTDHVPAEALAKAILAAFSDQVALRVDRGTLRCQLVHGRMGLLARESVVQKASLLVAAEVTEVGRQAGTVQTLLHHVTAIEEDWLRELAPEEFQFEEEVMLDTSTRRVVRRMVKRFRDLVLDSSIREEVTDAEAAAVLSSEIRSGRIFPAQWDDEVDRYMARVNLFARHYPEWGVQGIGPEEKQLLWEQICLGCRGYKDLKTAAVWPVLLSWLSAEERMALDRLYPQAIVLPSGRKAKIRYQEGEMPVLSARIQDLYDCEPVPVLADGRCPLKFEILAPNGRPVQITEDLAGFWSQSYPAIRKDLKGRYPKHEWR